MDAGEQRAVAPLDRSGRRARREPAAQDDAFGFERQQRLVEIGGGHAHRAGQRIGGDRAGDREPAAHELDGGAGRRPRLRRSRGGNGHRGIDRRRVEGAPLRQSLDGDRQAPGFGRV